MMKKQKQVFILAIFIFLFVSCISVLKHNEKDAAIVAIKFAGAALIERDFEKASKLLPVARQSPASIKQMEDLITKLHPASYPSSISATEDEPIPGQKAIRIFLVGENNQDEKFYYALVLT